MRSSKVPTSCTGQWISPTDIASTALGALLEGEDGEKRLRRAARLNRDKARLVEAMGVVPFRVIEGNNLWTIYRMIGKLENRVYVIRA